MTYQSSCIDYSRWKKELITSRQKCSTLFSTLIIRCSLSKSKSSSACSRWTKQTKTWSRLLHFGSRNRTSVTSKDPSQIASYPVLLKSSSTAQMHFSLHLKPSTIHNSSQRYVSVKQLRDKVIHFAQSRSARSLYHKLSRWLKRSTMTLKTWCMISCKACYCQHSNPRQINPTLQTWRRKMRTWRWMMEQIKKSLLTRRCRKPWI